MKQFIKKHKKLTAAFTVAALALGVGTAWAVYSASSSGTGSIVGTGTVTNPPTPIAITLSGSFSSATLAPGTSTSVTINGTFASDIFVQSIHLASVTVDSTHATAGCLGTWFTMPDVVKNTTIGGPGTNAPLGTGTLTFASIAGSQNACGGASLTLNLTSN